jgi:hypothetical protein
LPLDPDKLPKDADTLKKIVVDLAEQLDRVAGERDRESSEKNKYAEMIRELLEAQRARKSVAEGPARTGFRSGRRGGVAGITGIAGGGEETRSAPAAGWTRHASASCTI